MSADKEPVVSSHDRRHREDLEQLYARRVAINAVIKSLEDYDRLRAKRVDCIDKDGQRTA